MGVLVDGNYTHKSMMPTQPKSILLLLAKIVALNTIKVIDDYLTNPHKHPSTLMPTILLIKPASPEAA